MSIGICDDCLERVYHARTEDGRRLLLQPETLESRYMLAKNGVPKLAQISHKEVDRIEIVQDVYAYEVYCYQLHECPQKVGAATPSSGRELEI